MKPFSLFYVKLCRCAITCETLVTSIFTSCKNADVNKGERQVDSCMVTEEKKDSTDINVERKSLKQLLQHGERTELWELRNMQAIILDENL